MIYHWRIDKRMSKGAFFHGEAYIMSSFSRFCTPWNQQAPICDVLPLVVKETLFYCGIVSSCSSQVTSTLAWTSIRPRSYTNVSARCLIEITQCALPGITPSWSIVTTCRIFLRIHDKSMALWSGRILVMWLVNMFFVSSTRIHNNALIGQQNILLWDCISFSFCKHGHNIMIQSYLQNTFMRLYFMSKSYTERVVFIGLD